MRLQHLLFFAIASIKVLGQFGIVLQVVADDLINVRQLETREILCDFLWSGTAIERADDEVERDPANSRGTRGAPT